MKAIVKSFLPLVKGGITVTLTTDDESMPELVTMFRKEANLTLAVEGQEDRTTILMGIRETLKQVAEAVEKEFTHDMV